MNLEKIKDHLGALTAVISLAKRGAVVQVMCKENVPTTGNNQWKICDYEVNQIDVSRFLYREAPDTVVRYTACMMKDSNAYDIRYGMTHKDFSSFSMESRGTADYFLRTIIHPDGSVDLKAFSCQGKPFKDGEVIIRR